MKAVEKREYLREDKKFPHVWCAGCGFGTILGAIITAVDNLKLHRNDVAMVSGIGCSSRMPVYVDFNTLHTTHGRAIAFSTGLKLANPNLNLITVMGDGDAMAIGGNHFIHAARRNLDITALILNNYIYGMTGGQVSPTTPQDCFASTAPYGAVEQPFDVCGLAKGARAVFVARTAVYYVKQMENIITKAIRKKGFSVVEIVANCPTSYGRANKMGTGVDMLKWQKETLTPLKKYERLSEKEKAEKIPMGIFVDKEKPSFMDNYRALINEVRKCEK